MKKFKIEIQVTILSICIAVAVIISGYLAYQSLSAIVGSIHKEARPDLKLLLIKDISSDLNEVENTIRLYSLTGNGSFLKDFKDQKNDIIQKLADLQEYTAPASGQNEILDSIATLVSRKLLIWDEIRNLHRPTGTTSQNFTNLSSKIDTVIVEVDTIKIKPEEKKGFFKRLFSKKDTTRRSIIIDNTKEKEVLKAEIQSLEKNISNETKQLLEKDKKLLEKNIEVTGILNKLIQKIEIAEQKHLEEKTQEADLLAQQTFQRMAIFIIAAVILLIIVLFLFFRNLQQNKEYQKVLRKAKAEAENLAKAKEMFVATVSHEMRTPVNAIYGLTEQMLKKTSAKDFATDLSVVNRSAGHLLALVNDTLDFSKIESQKMQLEHVDFSLEELIAEIKIMHKEPAQKKGIELTFINETNQDLVLNGDPTSLKQILINLITNAIKFSNQGCIEVNFSAKHSDKENYLLQILVSDTGIGIPKDKLSQIFDEFVQVGTDLTQKQRGAGLGLAIVKKLILLQNGKIDVESILGRGTKFSLEIPYQKGNEAEIKKPSNEELQIPVWFHKLHFLIVDDEEFNLHLIRNILRTWEVTFSEAHDGQEALDLALKEDFDLILIDIRMPVMDGYDASQKILQTRKSAKIVALTATTRPEDIEKIKTSGIRGYLQKPFTEAALLETVLKMVSEDELPSKVPTENTIDLVELERLSGGDDKFLKEMLEIFIRTSEEASIKLEQYFDKSDWRQIAETAHKLAAPAKHIRGTQLYDLLKNLENTAETSNRETVEELISKIRKEVSDINSLIGKRLD